MGSIRFSGVRFVAYAMDHEPRHVHGFYAEVEVIADLRMDGTVALAKRTDAIRPPNGSRSDVKHVWIGRQNTSKNSWRYGRGIMAEHRVVTTDAEIDEALLRARALAGEPVARSIEHIADLNLLIVALSNGRRLVLPLEEVQGLGKATHEQIRRHELLGGGTGISFPELDVDLYVPALIEGVYGNRRWMAELGRKGGSVKSMAKRAAAKANGAKGGRPRKTAAVRG